VVARFYSRANSIRSLRALAKLRYTDPRERYSSRQAIAVERPNRIRVEVTTMLGTAFVLAAQDHRLTAYWPDEQTFFEGTATAENLWRYTRLWMPVETLVDVLLAVPGARQSELAACPEAADRYVCLRHASAGRGGLLVALDARGVPVEVEEQSAIDGSVLWRARYLEYTEDRPLAAPRHIVIEVPRYRRSVVLQLSEVELNPHLDPDVFLVARPPAARVVDLDEVETEEVPQ
jgi:hypothetical protein